MVRFFASSRRSPTPGPEGGGRLRRRPHHHEERPGHHHHGDRGHPQSDDRPTDSDDTPGLAYTYDDAGRRTGITDGTGTRTPTYDDAGRILTVSAPDDTAHTFTSAYDSAGHITSRTFPDGATTTYTYDADGRQKTQTADGASHHHLRLRRGRQPDNHGPSVGQRLHRYDAVGRLASVTTARATAPWPRGRSSTMPPASPHSSTPSAMTRHGRPVLRLIHL